MLVASVTVSYLCAIIDFYDWKKLFKSIVQTPKKGHLISQGNSIRIQDTT